MTTITSHSYASTNKPTHVAYHVRDAKRGKGVWTEIGSAWPHKDGKGFSIQVNAVPLEGRISLRTLESKSTE